jgi:hypothetical protein
LTFKNDRDQDDAWDFSVQSFALEIKGLMPETIVTVSAPPKSEPLSTPTLTSTHAISSDFDDFLETLQSQEISDTATFTTGAFSFETARENSSLLTSNSSPTTIDMNSDETSVFSCDTFKSALEPPLEVLLALGLLMDPITPQNQVSDPNELSAGVQLPTGPGNSCFPTRECSSRREETVDLASSMAGPYPQQYDISFVRNVGNVNIIGSRFVTNIVHYDDQVWVGLHTLHTNSDLNAFHNSYERQRRVHREMKAIRQWGSQLLVTSSTTPREFPLSVPRIKTRDLEEVVKDVVTWLYAGSSPLSIMWLYDEGDDGNSRTSLIADFLAKFLDERRDLTASYFYMKPDSPQAVGSGPRSIIPTLASGLMRFIPELKVPIALTAVKDPWIFTLSLDEQIKKLLVDPLRAASGDSNKLPRLFLIHALEDCEDAVFQELFLQAFGRALTLLRRSGIPQKLIVLGRHTTHLRKCFSTAGLQDIVRLRLLPISQDEDVEQLSHW